MPEEIQLIRDFIKEKAAIFGADNSNDLLKSYIERNNTNPDAFSKGGAYFGFIHPEEDVSGPFHDFSLTIFPDPDDKPWLVCLGVGTQGFKNDYELATFPGVRRLFQALIDEKGYCKSNFTDTENSLPRAFISNVIHLKKSLDTNEYKKFLPCCQVVDDPLSDDGKKVISAFVAGYAKLREWPRNITQRSAVSAALNQVITTNKIDDDTTVFKLLTTRKFIVLEGAPGTGKTRLAKILAEKLGATSFFTQFHAETSYSDFIYGIKPKLNELTLNYEEQKGIFIESIKYAKDNPLARVVLIIDEINRANLANILGPIFYLFEYKMVEDNVELEIGGGLKLKKVPDNFYVIGTMNTADRSLAVVDFALRRRFAWYTLKPKELNGANFCKEDFEKFNEIFNWYADSNELNLQPGQAYFIADNEEEMKNRIKYELFPLIKEYLAEGLILKAKEEFNNYFMTRINKSLFE